MRYMWDNDAIKAIEKKMNNQNERIKDQVTKLIRMKTSIPFAIQGLSGDEFSIALQENIDELNELASMVNAQILKLRSIVQECYGPLETFMKSEVNKLDR